MIVHCVVAGLAVAALATVAPNAGQTRQPLPDGTIPACFGVNIHFTGDNPQLDMIADGGFRIIRMDLTWGSVEKQKGVYDFANTGYDALSAGCLKRGIRLLYILCYSNRLHESERSVRTEEGRQAYAAYAEAAARHFAGQGVIWEFWNEPNVAQYWKPEANAADYVAMVKAAAPRIRAADPTGTLVAPALSTMDMKWLEDAFKHGLLEDVDAVTVHPYRDTYPEAVIPEYDTLRKLIAQYAPKGKDVPILSGEWGFATVKWDGSPRPAEVQAAFIARQFLMNLSQDVRMSIWYDWRNDGTDPHNVEQTLGTVTHDLQPKPAYVALKTLTTTLAGFKLKERLALGSDEDYALLFTSGKSRAVAAWTTGPDHEVQIPLGAAGGRLVKLFGETSQISWDKSGPKLTLTQNPFYIVIEK